MIFVSSSCVKTKSIREAVLILSAHGFRNIELSGGTEFYPDILEDLLELKKQYGLTYLLHNYFPPPRESVVLNLASLDNRIYSLSMDHFKRMIECAVRLEVKKIGIHAGFYIDFRLEDIGRDITKVPVNDRAEAMRRFISGYRHLRDLSGEIPLYIENNVISAANYALYKENPFMLTCRREFLELLTVLHFPLLLDVAHLKVSCSTLGLGFKEELAALISSSDYIHVSDNDGQSDLNRSLCAGSDMFQALCACDLTGKVVTIEVYDGVDMVKESWELLRSRI